MKNKNILVGLLILIFWSHKTEAQNMTIYCGDVMNKGTTTVLDTLTQDCFKTLLLQDNSVLEVFNLSITDTIKFTYGDTGSTTANDTIALRQISVDGYEYNDYRGVNDVNPLVILWNVPNDELPSNIIQGRFVDIEFKHDYTLAVDGDYVSEEDLKLLECVIYNFLGQVTYRGVFGDLFQGDLIDCKFSGIPLLVTFKNNAGYFHKKKYYVDLYNSTNCE